MRVALATGGNTGFAPDISISNGRGGVRSGALNTRRPITVCPRRLPSEPNAPGGRLTGVGGVGMAPFAE
jgi:hypothetical protein